MKLILIIIVGIILISLIFLFKFKFKHYRNILHPFPLNKFKNICGDKIVKVGDFTTTTGKASLYPKTTENCKLKDWFDKNNLKFGNKQTRLSFDSNSKNIISTFIFNWINKNKHLFPSSLKSRLSSDCDYTLRISRGKWKFPCHFDEVDNYMFILSGNRHAKIDGNKIILHPRDILYFESGTDHCFNCKSENDLNIVLNIVFKGKKISRSFTKDYPIQIKRINKKFDSI